MNTSLAFTKLPGSDVKPLSIHFSSFNPYKGPSSPPIKKITFSLSASTNFAASFKTSYPFISLCLPKNENTTAFLSICNFSLYLLDCSVTLYASVPVKT